MKTEILFEGGLILLLCCGRQFYAAEKIVLPKKDKLYRCLEYGHCPHCGARVSRLVEQDKNYEIFVKDRRGIKAFSAYQKAVNQRKRFMEQKMVLQVPKQQKIITTVISKRLTDLMKIISLFIFSCGKILITNPKNSEKSLLIILNCEALYEQQKEKITHFQNTVQKTCKRMYFSH